MARSKRLVHHPEANTRPAIRRRLAENQSPENITGDLNEAPPISDEVPIAPSIPDSGSSKQESPKDVSSSRVLDSSPTLFADKELEEDEEVLRLQEEFKQRMSAIKKRKEEELERIRKEEEERLRKEEEERLRKEEEERLRKEEEERLRKEEEERLRREAEEKRIREEEEKRKAEEARAIEEEKRRIEEERLVKGKEQVIENPQVAHTEEMPTLQETPGRKISRKKGMVTRSGKTKGAPSAKPKRKASRKGKGLEPALSSSSLDTNAGSEQHLSENPHQSTVGTEHAPSGMPRQFTTPAARAHYECISTQKLNLERGFDPDFIEASPFVKNRILVQDWGLIATANRRANASLVREFYAEASQTKEPFVKVRGKVVDYTAGQINKLLGRQPPNTCEFGQFVSKMTEADEGLILKAIAIEGKGWGKDGQRKCLPASSLTTEAAIWFQFLRATIAPTSHDTTLSMHKCAMLYCIFTNKKINLGIVMHGAIHQARTRNKVILPLPCLITSLIDVGVPAAESDQWLVSVKNISVQTIKKMRREIGNLPDEHAEQQPNVRIADEHIVDTPVPTVPKNRTPQRRSKAGEAGPSTTDPLTTILQAIEKLTYKVDLLAAQQTHVNRDLASVWAYTRERHEVLNQSYMDSDPLRAAQLPAFPEGICATMASDDEFEEEETDSSLAATPTP